MFAKLVSNGGPELGLLHQWLYDKNDSLSLCAQIRGLVVGHFIDARESLIRSLWKPERSESSRVIDRRSSVKSRQTV